MLEIRALEQQQKQGKTKKPGEGGGGEGGRHEKRPHSKAAYHNQRSKGAATLAHMTLLSCRGQSRVPFVIMMSCNNETTSTPLSAARVVFNYRAVR